MLFIIDFDGTVAPTDTVDALLETFADPEWRVVEDRWVAGQINSQECMAAQIALVSADRPDLEDFLQSVAIDPAFPAFVRYASTFADLAIVSDGLDYPIRHALRDLAIPPIPIYANRLGFRTGGLDISFPHIEPACLVKSGVCKCAAARSVDAGRGLTTVLIGDGRSDQCIARSANHVFAKGSLQKFCEQENIDHMSFDTFADVLAVVRRWNILPRKKVLEESACPLAQ
jgi:2-hydroxy-3-keto-5-methylthiopentenyl-1-phosphate phosphatase